MFARLISVFLFLVSEDITFGFVQIRQPKSYVWVCYLNLEIWNL